MKEQLIALEEKINNNPEHLKNLNASFSFDITDQEDVAWSVVFTGDKVELKGELLEAPDCLFKLNEKNFNKLLDGSLNATTAFMMGKIKVSGDLTLALKLQSVLNEYRA